MKRSSPRHLPYSSVRSVPRGLKRDAGVIDLIGKKASFRLPQAWKRSDILWLFRTYPELSAGFFERFTGYRRGSVRKWLDRRKPPDDVIPVSVPIMGDLLFYLDLKRKGDFVRIKANFDTSDL